MDHFIQVFIYIHILTITNSTDSRKKKKKKKKNFNWQGSILFAKACHIRDQQELRIVRF